MNISYLQGPGTLNDAAFQVIGDSAPAYAANKILVVAEVGLTGCYNDYLDRDEARAVWKKLIAKGWKRVSRPRRTIDQIRYSIQG